MLRFPIPAWEPDKSKLNQAASPTIKNCVPNADGYGPMNGLSAFSDALSEACRGASLFIDSAGVIHVFAGTSDSLFKLSGMSWSDVSGATYTLASGDSWSFALHQDDACAANVADPIQKYNLISDSVFSDLSSAAPQCRYLTTESGYLTALNLSTDPRAVQRSGYKDSDYWAIGLKGADKESLDDGGAVQGATSDETGAFVFQEKKVRRLQNRPGEEVSFSIATEVDSMRGTPAPWSIVQFGTGLVEFFAEDGFYRLGSPSSPIGLERIDRTILADIDLTRLDEVQGVADPVRKMNWWRYSSLSNASTTATDKMVGHHWYLDRWVTIDINLEWLLSAALPGYTLEQLDTSLGYTSIETIPYSLDSRIWKGGRPAISAFDASHKLGFFEADYLEAIMETADIQVAGDLRGYISGYRIEGDGDSVYGTVATKETLKGDPTYGSEGTPNGHGVIPCHASGLTMRFKVRRPAGTIWTHTNAVQVPDYAVRPAGHR